MKAFSCPTNFSVLFPLHFHSRSLPVSPLARSRTVPDRHPVCRYVCPPMEKRLHVDKSFTVCIVIIIIYHKIVINTFCVCYNQHTDLIKPCEYQDVCLPFHMSALRAGLCHRWILCTCCRRFGSSADVPLSVLMPSSSHSLCTPEPVCQSLLSFLHNNMSIIVLEKTVWMDTCMDVFI